MVNGYRDIEDLWGSTASDSGDDWETSAAEIQDLPIEEVLRIPEREEDTARGIERITVAQVPMGFTSAVGLIRPTRTTLTRVYSAMSRQGITIIAQNQTIKDLRDTLRGYREAGIRKRSVAMIEELEWSRPLYPVHGVPKKLNIAMYAWVQGMIHDVANDLGLYPGYVALHACIMSLSSSYLLGDYGEIVRDNTERFWRWAEGRANSMARSANKELTESA